MQRFGLPDRKTPPATNTGGDGAAGLMHLLRKVDDLPPLPEIALKVARLGDDPNAGTQVISQAVAADPALAARVLRLANSAYYGVPRRIGTMREALMVLGLRTLRSITLAAALHPAALGGVRHWRHGLACAVCAALPARR